MHGRRLETSVRTVLGTALLALTGLALTGAGQQPVGPPQARIEPLDITGENFAGLRLAGGVVEGAIELSAAKAWFWSSPGARQADGTVGPSVRRLLLSGDASVRLGSTHWSAARAVIWLSPLDAGAADAGPGVYQVFVYFDRAFTPTEDSSVGVSADRLPVRAVVKATGVKLKADRSIPTPPTDDDDAALVREGERSLAVRLRNMLQGRMPDPVSPDDLARQGRPIPPLVPGLGRTYQPSAADDPSHNRDLERRLGPAEREEPIFGKSGVIAYSSRGDVKTVVGPEETAVTMTGGVTIQYWERERDQTLELTAERAVMFVDPASPGEGSQFDVKNVRGLYLEGDVVATIVTSAGRYTVRSPKVFYSIRDDRALLLDAVFWTYDEKRGLPLYVRAKSISQEAANTFKATGAILTNTAFFEPDFSIGTQSVTLTRRKTDEGDSRVFVDARHITLNAGGIPVFYWPILRGDPQSIPIRNVGIKNSSESGTTLETTWNLYALLGIQPSGNGDADLLLDWHFGRGVGLGTRMNWSDPGSGGGLLVYTLPEDTGRDVLVTGEKKEFDGDWRGIVLAEHRAQLNDEWSLAAEGAYLSDETFVDGFFESMATSRREVVSAVHLRRLRDNSALWAGARGTFNDFLSNQYLKQTPGYTVEKTPDIGYVRIADDLLDAAPGLLTYTSEYRLSRMRLRFDEARAKEYGFSNATQSQKAFGITPNQSIADRLRLEGYTDEPVTRFDTRHEFSLQLMAGPVTIQPFVAGRATIYDEDFSQFQGGGGGTSGIDDSHRLWASEGVTFATELQRVDNGAESRLFDIHRLRHIIQPSVSVWHADTSVDRVDLPVYDDDVESLAEGTATRIALNQTWQTQRGGPGRWRSVDVFKLNSGLTASSSDVDQESPIGRFIDYRPELSNLGGEFGDVNASWQVSEVLGLGALTVYDFDLDHLQKTAIGATLQHTPDFATFADYRTINSQDQTYFVLGAAYELTPKYSVDLSGAYDTRLGELQSMSGQVSRKFPSVILGVGTTYNNITNESSIGIIIRPVGSTRPGARLQGLGQPGGGIGMGG